MLTDPENLQRWGLAWIFGGLDVATLLFSDANRTSMHPFCRERLSSADLVRRNRLGRSERITPPGRCVSPSQSLILT